MTHELDLRDFNCPIPVLKTKKALHALKPGDALRVLVNGEQSVLDLRDFCNKTGHRIIAEHRSNDSIIIDLIHRELS